MAETISQPTSVSSPPASSPAKQLRLIIIIGLIFLLMFVVGGLLAYIMQSNKPTNNSRIISPTATPTIPMTEKYDNPFDAKSQYQNPFSQSTNPFDTLVQ